MTTGIENPFKFVPVNLFHAISLRVFLLFSCFDPHHIIFKEKKPSKLKPVINVSNGLQVIISQIIYGLITALPCIRCSERNQHAGSGRAISFCSTCRSIISRPAYLCNQRLNKVSLKLRLPVILHHGCVVGDGRHVNISFADVRQSR